MNTLQRAVRIIKSGFPQRRSRLPQLVIFHITTRCNLACRHCSDDVWGDPKNDLTLDEIAKFSTSLGTFESLALGGGEPFLRQDLGEICRLFTINNKVSSISIPSNGFAPDKICTAVRSILTECPDVNINIMLSLDGFQTTHDSIRTSGSYAKVMETGHLLKTMTVDSPRLSLSFNATINNCNWEELPSLALFVLDNFRSRLEFNIISGNPRDGELTAPGRKELEGTIDGLFDGGNKSLLRRMYNQVYRDVLLKTNFGTHQVIPCRAGSLVSLIDANGDVRACSMLPPLGNLRTGTFEEIWHGELALKQFRSIVNGGCSCNNDCFIRLSLMNYWKLPFLVFKRAINFGNDSKKV